MADQENETSSVFNLNTLLAIVTVIGGVVLVSHQLSSQRPASAPRGRAQQTIGEQSVDARLWEDPFCAFTKDAEELTKPETLENSFGNLTNVLATRARTNPASVHVVPAFIPGGPYAEDRESRIRSRFAVISALGAADYAPEDAEHLGNASMCWPTRMEMEAPDSGGQSSSGSGTSFVSTAVLTLSVPSTNGAPEPGDIVVSGDLRMPFAFEWFRRRTFGAGNMDSPASVLVLWIDDDMIQDSPLERIALLISQVVGDRDVRLSVLGPQRSSTLRAMVADSDMKPAVLWKDRPELSNVTKQILSRITFHSSTASVMDEALLNEGPNDVPRQAVREHLRRLGVKEFINYSCTDSQLAASALHELELRNVGLSNKNGHLVLVGEWDTFYGRMLSLTYAAELANQQTGIQRQEYVERHRKGENVRPQNLHLFNYLRGLDGQGLNLGNADKKEDESKDRKRVRDFSDMATWTPDQNKAEGAAQLDYLARLGDQIAQLERDLTNVNGQVSIRAIGVVGSDVYDTLLILQALRKRFQNAVFFTTDLDARIWHPREFEWTRGLVVVSSYGLTVAEKYQSRTLPFRDSLQTAQYVGMLGALGYLKEGDLRALTPRRFEVGRGTAVDLTVGASHPLQPRRRFEMPPVVKPTHLLTMVGLSLLLAFVLIRPLRNLVLARSLNQVCWIQQMDLGDIKVFIQRLLASQDRLAVELVTELKKWERGTGRKVLFVADPRAQKSEEAARSTDAARARRKEGESVDAARCALIDFLNDRIDATWWMPPDVLAQTKLLPADRQVHFQGWRAWMRPLFHLAKNRREINMLFDRLEFSFADSMCYRPEGWAKAATHDDPLAQWLTRTAANTPGTTADSCLQTLTGCLSRYPWAPRRYLLTTNLLNEQTKGNYKWYMHVLRLLKILSRPEAQTNREEMDEFLDKLFDRDRSDPTSGGVALSCESTAAAAARKGSTRIFWMISGRMVAVIVAMAVVAACALPMVRQAWDETYKAGVVGEPFSLTSGISAWPTEFLRLIAVALAFCFLVDSYCSLRIGVYQLARRFRMLIADDSPRWFLFFARWPIRKARTDAAWLWTRYQQMGGFWKRFRRVFILGAIYVAFATLLMSMEGFPSPPIRGDFLKQWDPWLLGASGLMFLLLAFWTIDASLLCRWFIEHLSRAPTQYPQATLRYFQLQNGDVEEHLLEEWIDTELIAELTERVGRLVYYPSIVMLLLFISRNRWWDAWPWPKALIVIFVLNMLLAVTSVFIVQKAAAQARKKSIESLDTKLKVRRQEIEEQPQASYHLGERLLEDLKNVRRGAFAPFWQNPAIGALLLPSGGIAMMEVLLRFWTQ